MASQFLWIVQFFNVSLVKDFFSVSAIVYIHTILGPAVVQGADNRKNNVYIGNNFLCLVARGLTVGMSLCCLYCDSCRQRCFVDVLLWAIFRHRAVAVEHRWVWWHYKMKLTVNRCHFKTWSWRRAILYRKWHYGITAPALHHIKCFFPLELQRWSTEGKELLEFLKCVTQSLTKAQGYVSVFEETWSVSTVTVWPVFILTSGCQCGGRGLPHWQPEIRTSASEYKGGYNASGGCTRDRERKTVNRCRFKVPGETFSILQYREILICCLWQHF